MSSSKDVVIVGGGIIGLCCAYYCLERGHSVTVIEQGDPSHDSCSLGNAGMVVPSHFVPLAAPGMLALGARMMLKPRSPFYIRPRLDGELVRWAALFARSSTTQHVSKSAPLLRDLQLASRALYEDLSANMGDDFGLTRNGLLMLFKTEKALHEEIKTAEMACELGIEAKVLSSLDTARLDPAITMDVAGSVYFPQDCHITPQVFMSKLTQHLVDRGAKIVWNTSAAYIESSRERIRSIRTSVGSVEGEEFVVAAGAWSPTLLRRLGIKLPMQAGKGYSVTLPDPEQTPRICSLLMEARVAVTPMLNGLRLGGTMEVTGLDLSISKKRVEGILHAIPGYFPRLETAKLQDLPVWSGLRPCSPDGLPYVGRFKNYPNLVAATGHAMMGVSMGPITGQIVASILSGEKPPIDISSLSPDRFS